MQVRTVQLEDEAKKYELAKDVSGIASRSSVHETEGGHILLGVQTKKSLEHHRDLVAAVSPFPQGWSIRISISSYQHVACPGPRGRCGQVVPSAADNGRASSQSRFPGRGQTSGLHRDEGGERRVRKASGTLVGYFERRGGAHRGDDPQELQRLLRDGRRFDVLLGQISR